MSVNLYKLRKWTKMMLGKSISHVNQKEGRLYSKELICGYYNDLTEKVTKGNGEIVPKYYVDTGEKLYFSIGIFQYGLGAYDLYLLSGKKDLSAFDKVKACADWAVENQQEDGAWSTFAFENPGYPYSSMAQGEGISLLLRIYSETPNNCYLRAAEKAKDFMLKPFEEGGTAKYEGKDVYLYEYPKGSLVLNGWIFSIWGLMDYCKVVDDNKVRGILYETLLTLEKKLSVFDIKYWSLYDDANRIASPFYHKLHIAQLNVMFDLTGHDVYREYAMLWDGYADNGFNRMRAFVKKVFQKIFE